MVAVVNGSGLGLFTSRGSSGSAGLGQSRDQVFVNSTTGNLVIQGTDEILTATGADIAVTRTYNSLGITDGDNNDGWRVGVLRSLVINAGVSIVKTFGDGARVTYNWNGTEYVSTEGDGAHDKIAASGSNWVWTDGSGRDTETYDSAGKLLNSKDASGNTVTYTYGSGVTANVIVQITVVSPSAGNGGDGSTTVINFTYNPGTLDLERVATVRNGVTETLTYYTYDAQHRLSTVTVDLSPANNSTSDNDSLVTTYTYQGTTNLVASITQRKSGSSNVTASVSFTYQLIDGDYRLKTYTDGENHTTTFTYTTAVTTGASNSTANANSGVLSTTETQNVTNTYNLNSAAVSTTDTTTNTYNVISSALTTNATQTDTYNRNNAALSTTDTTTNTYNVNSAALTTNATQTNTYNRNDAALSTTDTTTNTYTLNSGALTTPAGGGSWAAAQVLATPPSNGRMEQSSIAFDANGNAVAVWFNTDMFANGSIFAQRYTRSTNTWSAVTTLQSGNVWETWVGGEPLLSLAVDSSTGNAVVAWQDYETQTSTSRVMARFLTASTGVWSGTIKVATGFGGPRVAISGTTAAMTMTDTTGSLIATRFNGTSWSAVQLMESLSTYVGNYSIAMDNQGNVNVLFEQGGGIYRNRYTASTATWSGATSVISTGGSTTRTAIDSNGDGFAVWAQGTDIMMSRYTRSTNTWSAASAIDSTAGTLLAVDLAIDSAGNAIVGWVRGTSVYAKTYNASTSTWGTAALLQSGSQAAAGYDQFKVSIAGGKAAATWLRSDGTVNSAFAAIYNGTAWSAASGLDSLAEDVLNPAIAIDSAGNATALYLGTNIYSVRFTPGGGGGAPYYTVPAGATWQSIANALYGINSTAAGTALQTAMGNPALTTGAQLTGWPATLSVTTTVTVPAYYNVPAGATWQSIANAVYGVNSAAAGSALQTAMGNPTLSTGLHLTGFPATLSVTTTLPAHYLVPSGATWQSIANALYGVNSSAAGSALQTALGNPSIAAGQRLYSIPSTLTVTTTVTVPAYYNVPAGATWQSIANAVYGVNSAAAGSALQTAMGNPTLSTGLHLTGLPATLSVTTTLAPHYLVPTSATWQSIANALFGVNSAAAGSALQTALGNPSIAAGQRLYSIPSTLTVTTTVTVPAYYTIPSSPTWQAIANTLYGVNSAAAGSALQSALGNPTLTPGNRLTNLPATLSVTTTQTVTVPAYYVVPAGATWTSITQAVYNTSHPNAVAALQTATGNPTLTTNLHLTVPLSLTYAVTAASTLYRNTDVVDALGLMVTYQTDTLGRITNSFTPTIGGARIETRYTYDAEGNIATITQDPTGLNRVTTMTYNNGNLLSTKDPFGNTVTRTYSTTNQVLTETQYLVPDTGGGASSPLVTHYVYDTADRLRFVITPEGRVTENRYQSATGMLLTTMVYTSAAYTGSAWTDAALTTFATTNQGAAERTDYFYDFRGNLSESRRFVSVNSSGVGTGTPTSTLYVYDARGLLKTITEARGAATTGDLTDYITSFTYDGLGRQLTKTEWIDATRTRTTTTVWSDASRQFSITLTQTGAATGLVTTTTYDRAGVATSVVNTSTASAGLGTTSYLYDADNRRRVAIDPNLNKTYYIYDELSRVVGEVDALGRLTQYVFDNVAELTKTIRYSSFLSSSTMSSLSAANGVMDITTLVNSLASVPGRDATKDQVTRNTYDAAGRVTYNVNPNGGVTQYFYDGASRVTGTLRYATQIAAGAAPNTVSADPVNDRRTRNFYDNDGKLIGTLDAQGFVVESEYDKAGHLVHQIAYANPTSSAAPYTDAFSTVRPSTDTETAVDYETDAHTYFYYDGQGRQVAVLDAEGYLTELTFDLAGNATQSTRYQNRASYNASLATVRAAATGGNLSESSTFDGARRVKTQTNIEGTTTTLDYNALDQITSTTIGNRQRQTRYDELGRVKQELGGEGSAQTPMSETIWTQWGVTHTVDAAGRRTMTVDQYGNRTLFYYDLDNRLRYTVKDLGTGQGEVVESVYNALGQASDQVAYTTRIAMSGLNGGAIDSAFQTALNAAINAAIDSRTTYTYKPGGQVATQTNVEGALTTNVYNGFGELDTSTTKINATQNRVTQYQYDRRGLLTKVIGDGSGINQTTTYTYDAFGRRTSTKDQYNNTARAEYDRVGRTIATYSPVNAKHVTNYDAFGRVVSTVDAYNNTTSYTYNVAAKSMTVTSPENVSVTTVHNQFGETLTVTDGVGNVTSYQYDRSGNVTLISDSLGTIETRTYDRAGRLDTSKDGLNVVTRFTYDAMSRTLTRTQDYGGLALVTSYQYDGQGRVTRVTEPGNRITDTSYYTDGRVKMISVDPSGANLRTLYEYDAAGDAVKVTQHYGSTKPLVTKYIFDNLNRRIEEIVDPTEFSGTLNLRTLYKYDANGKLTRKIEGAQLAAAQQRNTWYVYDAAGRLAYTVDALGGVTENTYDLENRVTAVRRYSNPVSTGGFGDIVTSLSISGNDNLDRLERTVYDRDGRAAYAIDAQGGVLERQFDAGGHVTRARFFRNVVSVSGNPSVAQLSSALTAAGNDLANVHVDDRISWAVYDLRGRLTYGIDGSGSVIKDIYDADDRLIETRRYATSFTGATKNAASLNAWLATTVSGQSYTVDADPNNRITKSWYDNVGRVRYRLDAQGYLAETIYNDAARIITEKAFISGPYDISSSTPASAFSGFVITDVDDRVVTTERDTAGRVFRVTDAYGYYEQYGYDSAGNKTSFRNKLGSVWTYDYDVLGRLTTETSPAVSSYSVTDGGASLSLGAATNAGIVTKLEYTSFGDVWKRTEAFGTPQARTTEYVYDLLGRQTRTNLPAVSIYNAGADSLNRVGANVVRTDTAAQVLYTEVTYDTLGDAVVDRDVAGNYSYRVYDKLGQLRFEVDAEGYVTQHQYDIFSNETTLTRYANKYTGTMNGTPIVFNTFAVPTASSADRAIYKQFDRLGRVTREIMSSIYWYSIDTIGTQYSSAQPVTEFYYNAFGEVFQKSTLTAVNNAGGGIWSTTLCFYDKLGRAIAVVDPLNYLTATQYDAVGNVKRKIEYAAALSSPSNYATPTLTNPTNAAGSAIGYDRDTSYTYDRLNRLLTETRNNVEYSTLSGAATSQSATRTYKNVTTTYGYDAVGNRISTTDDAGAVVREYYDALGRTIAIVDVLRDRGDNFNLLPLTTYKRDALGNVVQQTGYYYGIGSIPADGSVPTPYSPSASYDETTTTQYDALGRVLRAEDAIGADTYFSYTARGDVAKQWQFVTNTGDSAVYDAIVTVHQYDKLGREVVTLQPQTLNLGGADTTPNVVVKTTMQYNAFGEIERRSMYEASATAPAPQEVFDYDNAGRLWRTNSGDGITKVYLYDLAGRKTAEFRSRNVDLMGSANASAAVTAATGGGVQTIRVETRFDAAGRAIEQRQQSYGSVNLLTALETTVAVGTLYKPNLPGNGYYFYQFDDNNTQTRTEQLYWAPQAAVTGSVSSGGYDRNNVKNSSYALTSGRYIYWADPANIVGDVQQVFEYAPTGTNSWTSLALDKVIKSDGSRYMGVNVGGLGTATYDYRIRYFRSGESNPFITKTGTVVNPQSATTTTDTTAAVADLATTVTPITYQTSDRWGNVLTTTDSLGGITRYRYSQDGLLIEKQLPTVSIVSVAPSTGAVTTTTAAPKQENHYDSLGRLIATKDANGVVNSLRVNLAGQIIAEVHADGGNKTYVYDAFGNRVGMTDELGFKTRYTYNRQNLQTKIEQEAALGAIAAVDTANIVVQQFGYDEAHRRVTVADGMSNTEKTWYDLRGHVRKRMTASGGITTMVADVYGNTILESNAVRDSFNANGDSKEWTYDYFGRVLTHRELGTTWVGQAPGVMQYQYGYSLGTLHTYSRDFGGFLTQETSTDGKNVTYSYNTAGYLTGITENGTATGASGLTTVTRQTDFTLDAMGRHIIEKTAEGGVVLSKMFIRYDAAGRIASAWDYGGGAQYSYDAEGNRTHLVASSNSSGNAFTATQNVPHYNMVRSWVSNDWYTALQSVDVVATDYWYKYDVMGRLKISRATNPSGTLTIAPNTIQFNYDLGGNRISQVTQGGKWNSTGSTITLTNEQSVDEYIYDGARRITSTKKDGIFNGIYHYDLAGRQDTATTTTIGYQNYIISTVQTNTFRSDGKISTQTTQQASSQPNSGGMKTVSVTTFGSSNRTVAWDQEGGTGGDPVVYLNPHFVWSNGYDLSGTLRTYSVNNYENNAPKYTVTYRSTFRSGEAYLETKQESKRTAGTGGPVDNSTSKTYDLNGNLVSFVDALSPTTGRYFAHDSAGNIVTTVYGNAVAFSTGLANATAASMASNGWSRYFFANGESIGSVGAKSGSSSYGPHQDFAFNVDDSPIDPDTLQTPSTVVVNAGDTLRIVAQRLWGDANLWYVLAEENGFSDPDAALTAGTTLRVPNQIINAGNRADVWQPFDMGQAIGDTSPIQAGFLAKHNHAKSKCGVLQIVVIIIAIIVTILVDKSGASLQAALATTVGETAASVIVAAGAAAIGSIVAQGVGIAIGAQDSFDWKQVALAAVTAGIAKGVGGANWGGKLANAMDAPKWVGTAINGAISSAMTQGASIALGMQESFSWREVGISALASIAADKAGGAAEESANAHGAGTFSKSLQVGLASGLAGSAVRAAFGGKVDLMSTIADSFAHAIGNSIAEKVVGPPRLLTQRQKLKSLEDHFLEKWNAEHPGAAQELFPMLTDEMPAMSGALSTDVDELLAGSGHATDKYDHTLAATDDFQQGAVAATEEQNRNAGYIRQNLLAGAGYDDFKNGLVRKFGPNAIYGLLNAFKGLTDANGNPVSRLYGLNEETTSLVRTLTGGGEDTFVGYGAGGLADHHWSFSAREVTRATLMVVQALRQGNAWDRSKSDPYLLYVTSPAKDEGGRNRLYWAAVSAVGGRSDAPLYDNLRSQVFASDSLHRLINVSLLADQGDANSSTYVAAQESVRRIRELKDRVGEQMLTLEVNTAAGDPYTGSFAFGIQHAMLSHLEQLDIDHAFMNDALAPADMRVSARNSFYFALALDATSLLPAVGPAFRGASVVGRTVATQIERLAMITRSSSAEAAVATEVRYAAAAGESAFDSWNPVLKTQREISLETRRQASVVDRWLRTSDSELAQTYRTAATENPNFATMIRGRVIDRRMNSWFEDTFGDIAGVRIDRTIEGSGLRSRPDLYFPNLDESRVIFDIGGVSKIDGISKYSSQADLLIPILH